MRQVNIYRAVLATLLLGVAVSSLQVILADNQPLWFDPTTNVVPSVMFKELLLGNDEVTWSRWLASTTERLWLSSMVHLPFMLFIPEPVRAVRVAELCLLLGVIWGVYGLGCRLAGRRAGLLSASLLVGAPFVLSWGRGGNADPVIWGTLLLLFGSLVQLDLRRPRQAMCMGVFAGLAASSRLFALVHLSAAALWVLVFAVRSRRAAMNLVPAALASLILPGWWMAICWPEVSNAASRSSGNAPGGPWGVFGGYLSTGLGVVVLVAGLALALALWRRLLPRRQLGLFGLMIFMPAFQLVFYWDVWGRYFVSLMPLCALLIGVTAVKLSVTWAPGWRRIFLGVLALVGFAPLVMIHLGELPYEGLIRPDERKFHALRRTLSHVPPTARVLVIHSFIDEQFAFCLNLRQPPRFRRRLYAQPDPSMTWNLPSGKQAPYLLRVQLDVQEARKWDSPPFYGLARSFPSRFPFEDPFIPFAAKRYDNKLQQLARHRDPDGVIFTLYQLSPPYVAGEFQ